METKLSSCCHVLESDGKTLLFNPRNLEMVLMTSKKFHENLNTDDISKLESIDMVGNVNEELYDLETVFPDHISKAYLLFGTDCNISCRYCTVKHNAEKYYYKGSMSDQTLAKSLEILFEKNTGLEHITLYGGEPLLHKEKILRFFKYLDTLPKNKVPRIDLITNGILLDHDVIKELIRWNALVIVSLDGLKTHHDTFRLDMDGKGTYERVISGISAYREAGLRVGISIVLGKHNYKNIREICAELKQKYDIVSIGLTLPHIEPEVATDENFNFFLYNSYDKLLDICQEQGLWFEQGMKRLLSLAKKRHYIYGCPSTSKGSMIRILPDGTVTLCENMGLRGLYHLGNVNEDILSATEINNNPLFQHWYERCTNNNEKCQGCIAYAVCGMGCPYDAWLETGKIDSIESRSCSISRQAVEWYLNRVIKMAELPDTNELKILDISERKRVLVECPWEKKSY